MAKNKPQGVNNSLPYLTVLLDRGYSISDNEIKDTLHLFGQKTKELKGLTLNLERYFVFRLQPL